MAYIGNAPAEAYSTISKQTITGNGTTGPYTLDYAVANGNEIEVFVNNVRQEPSVAYTVSGTALTMTGAVASTDDFYVVFQGKAVQTIVPADATVTTAMLQDSSVTSAKIAAGTVTAADLASTLDLSGKTVTLPAGTGGKVLQVVSTNKTNTFVTSGSAGTYDITGLSVDITPSSTSSKILVLAMVHASSNTNSRGGLLLTRDTTDLLVADADGSRTRATAFFSGSGSTNNIFAPCVINYLDSPNKSISTTYKIKAIACDFQAITINRSWGNSDSSSVPIGSSSITVMEIAG